MEYLYKVLHVAEPCMATLYIKTQDLTSPYLQSPHVHINFCSLSFWWCKGVIYNVQLKQSKVDKSATIMKQLHTSATTITMIILAIHQNSKTSIL